MAVLLDTADIPREARVEAVHDAMMYASVPSHVRHEEPLEDVHALMSYWQLGAASLFSMRSSGIRLTRTPKQLRIEAPERIALAVQTVGHAAYTQNDHAISVDLGEMMLVDLTAPYDFWWPGEGASLAFQLDYDRLGLPVEVVRRAAPRLRSSPLYELVRGHIVALGADADRLSEDPAASVIGSATTELVRALLTSAAQDETSRQIMAESLLTRIVTYIRQHLTDPGLCAGQIAREHNISVRHLYALWASGDASLAQWIITERLEGARHDLAKPDATSMTIAAVARRWGFADASHFSRRFRDAFQMSPREWRELKQVQRAPTGAWVPHP